MRAYVPIAWSSDDRIGRIKTDRFEMVARRVDVPGALEIWWCVTVSDVWAVMRAHEAMVRGADAGAAELRRVYRILQTIDDRRRVLDPMLPWLGCAAGRHRPSLEMAVRGDRDALRLAWESSAHPIFMAQFLDTVGRFGVKCRWARCRSLSGMCELVVSFSDGSRVRAPNGEDEKAAQRIRAKVPRMMSVGEFVEWVGSST